MSKIYLIGDSHAGIYGKAARQCKSAIVVGGPLGAATLFFKDFFEAGPGGFAFHSDVVRQNYLKWKSAVGVADLGECRGSLVVSLGLASAPFYGHQMWLLFGQNGRIGHFLSSGMLEQIIQDLQQYVLLFMQVCIERNLLLAAVSGPPPQRRHRSISAIGPERVLAMHHAFQKPVLDYLYKAGIPVVESRDTIDANGFLLRKYWGKDPNHASIEYGGLIVNELERLQAGLASTAQSVKMAGAPTA